MAILRQIEWNLNAWRRDRKRKRKWKREREAATLPDPTCVWTRDGFTVQAFVVKSGFSVFASIEPLFRVGVVKMSRNGPTFSPYFPKHGAEILLALLEQVESWNAMLSKVTIRQKTYSG